MADGFRHGLHSEGFAGTRCAEYRDGERSFVNTPGPIFAHEVADRAKTLDFLAKDRRQFTERHNGNLSEAFAETLLHQVEHPISNVWPTENLRSLPTITLRERPLEDAPIYLILICPKLNAG